MPKTFTTTYVLIYNYMILVRMIRKMQNDVKVFWRSVYYLHNFCSLLLLSLLFYYHIHFMPFGHFTKLLKRGKLFSIFV